MTRKGDGVGRKASEAQSRPAQAQARASRSAPVNNASSAVRATRHDNAPQAASHPGRAEDCLRESRPLQAPSLWEAYQQHGDQSARDALLERHLPLVHHVARQIMRTLSVQVDLDDLVSAGSMGLINAVASFDPSRGLAFSTYAAPRIRGAILDDLRRSDHVPRSIRRKQRQISAAEEALSGTLERHPTDRETADQLGIDIDTLWRWKADTEEAVHVSLDQPVNTAHGRTAMPAELLQGGSGTETEERVNHHEEALVLRDEIMRLKERERIVLTLYYFEELKLHEIARVLGLTESRVSQIRSKALLTLRGRMGHLRGV
ncbi:MAG: sigma-70 family RNA polymerase sigma factor [Longimicrobiales bacterium]